MAEYLSPKWKSFLEENSFSTFKSLWERDDEWFEKPNTGRSKNGWSGVCKIEIAGKSFFLKKQENFYAYSIKHPLGISVAEREFKNLKMFDDLKVPAMHVVYFGVRKERGKLQGIIITEDLDKYISFQEVKERWNKSAPTLSHKRNVLKECALLLRHAHKTGVMHCSLYPKHIFVDKSLATKNVITEDPVCRFIDMEKATKAAWGSKKQLRDLETLNRRSINWNKQDRLYFLMTYLQKEKADNEVRQFIKRIKSITKN